MRIVSSGAQHWFSQKVLSLLFLLCKLKCCYTAQIFMTSLLLVRIMGNAFLKIIVGGIMNSNAFRPAKLPLCLYRSHQKMWFSRRFIFHGANHMIYAESIWDWFSCKPGRQCQERKHHELTWRMFIDFFLGQWRAPQQVGNAVWFLWFCHRARCLLSNSFYKNEKGIFVMVSMSLPARKLIFSRCSYPIDCVELQLGSWTDGNIVKSQI